MGRRSGRPTQVRVDFRCYWSWNGGHDKRAALFWIDLREADRPLHSRLPGGLPVAEGLEVVDVACPVCGECLPVRLAEVVALLKQRAATFGPSTFVWPVGECPGVPIPS